MGVVNAPQPTAPVISLSATAVKRGVITRQLPVISALSVESVCTDGRSVAINFSTMGGIQPVRVPLSSFVEHCRAPLDSNNRPFTTSVARREVLVADAEQVPITKGVSRGRRKGTLTPDQQRIIRQAWSESRIAGVAVSYSDVAALARCSAPTVRDYFIRFDAQAENQA